MFQSVALFTIASGGRSGGDTGERSRGDGGEKRGRGDDSEGRGSGEGRAGGGQGLHMCRYCGEDTGSTSALYRHVNVRCLARLGETMTQFKKKFRADQGKMRYRQRLEEMRVQARHKVSESPHLILWSFGIILQGVFFTGPP